VELFPLVSCILQENYVQSWAFPTFVALLLWAQKLISQLWRMIWGTVRNWSITKGPENILRLLFYLICWKCSFAASLFMTNISHNASMYVGCSHVFPMSYIISGKNDCWLRHSEPQCWCCKIRTIFWGVKNEGYVCQKKIWKHYCAWSKM